MQQWKNKRERKNIGFPLLSFFFELLELFLDSRGRVRLFVKLRENEGEVFLVEWEEESLWVFLFWWCVLRDVGVVFIVVFLEDIIITSHGILWIWKFLLKIIFVLFYLFQKLSHATWEKFHWILDWYLFSLWKEICLKTFSLDSLLIDFWSCKFSIFELKKTK